MEIVGWEHECCGPSFERNAVVQLTCLVVTGPDQESVRHVETHHDLETTHEREVIRGRVVDIAVQHPDGSVDQLERLPSGEAIRGFDEHDDGKLERPWTGDPIVSDSSSYLITIAR